MLNWKVAGGPDRNHNVVMEIHINKVCIYTIAALYISFDAIVFRY